MRLLRARSALRLLVASFAAGAALLLVPFEAGAQDFGLGNIVVVRLGDGAAPLTSSNQAVYLDEYTPAGVFVRSVPLPQTTVGANRRLTIPGTPVTGGVLSLSTDRRYLTVAGYDAAVGSADANGSAASTINRVVARIDGAGNVATTRTFYDWADLGTARGVILDDNVLWLTGSTGGMRIASYTGLSSNDVTLAGEVKNLRVPGIFGGTLYTTSGSGAIRLASIPKTNSPASVAITNLPGFPTTGSPYGFFFADLNPAIAGVDTVYVADDSAGVQKYCLSAGGTWFAFGGIAGSTYRNMTGKVNGTAVTLYVTRNSDSELAEVQDTGGWGSSQPMTAALLATAPTNTTFRGVALAPAAEMVTNGALSSTTTNWTLYATPTPAYIQYRLTNQVFEYYRVSPPAGTTNQAVIYQETGRAVAANSPIVARFLLYNSSSVRKRLSVLILNSTFNDLSVCTFWLPPQGYTAEYQMRMHPTTAWSNASIYFYAASTESWGGYYQLSRVSMVNAATDPFIGTQCVDPVNGVNTVGGFSSGNLLTNGDFSTGVLAPWGTFGITTQLTNGVLELIKPSNTPPSGVVLQATGQAVAPSYILTANFQLGNSSSVRKRVTVLLHDGNFSDLSACTFWLPPATPLANYAMRAATTQAWTNATLSVYPATAGPDPWIRVDNVTLRYNSKGVAFGTDCMENLSVAARPADTVNSTSLLTVVSGPGNIRTASESEAAAQQSTDAGTRELSTTATPGEWLSLPRGVFVAVAGESGDAVKSWEQTVDASADGHAWLRFDSLLNSRASWGEVLMRRGDEWVSVHALRADSGTGSVEIDLGAPAADRVELQFVLHGVSAQDDPADLWRVGDVSVSIEP